MKLLENLLDYKEPLDLINITGREYRTKSDYHPNVIFTLAFGENEKSSYNENLALATINAKTYFDNPLTIVQSNVFNFLQDYTSDYISIGQNNLSTRLILSKISTSDCFNLLDNILDENNLNKDKILYIAHPAHIYRVMEIGKKRSFFGFPFIEKEVVWPKDDEQLWIRKAYFWVPREFLCRIHHKVKGIL